ncbi:DJ-1/PfpI family protein [Terrimicrobium sacchariphilum]|uniref:DJ-1/PfpI family protein n=1 Tax=Terrimicrobium sacchariphilum TaxID=690879 RepID=A0A146GA98_TERSA|nr:DJ-1/PfpI family protein [Terrimicrobium sacchariphilum]GAT34351.1 DJ-1/PfpI family protein [Terrimicrobium sacchariphilum]
MKEINPVTRRKFFDLLTLLGGGLVLSACGQASGPKVENPQPEPVPSQYPQIKLGEETILILIYPGFTAIDALGPEYILSGMMGAKVRLVSKDGKPVTCETGYQVVPHFTFRNCPTAPTLLVVPGGTSGTLDAMADRETLQFLRKVGGAAEMAGSVCTGSLLLGAAGLLHGYKATSHWQTRELLPLVGAIPTDERVVIDRNRITGAGVTAGFDFALRLVQHYRGDFYAKGMELLAQYDPHPPFPGGGDPKTADPDVVALLNEMHKPFVDLCADAIQQNKLPPIQNP